MSVDKKAMIPPIDTSLLSCEFKQLSEFSIPLITTAFEAIGWNKPTSLYEKYLQEQTAGERWVWLAFEGGQFAGYVTLKKTSDYPPFRDHAIPEIADLNVLLSFRNKGIGTALLHQAEAEARKTSRIVGIGVGLTADYGPAQRLYTKQGYVLGVTSHTNPLIYGQKVQVDDDLILWATKRVN